MGVPSFYKWLVEKYPKIVCSNYINDCDNNDNNNNNNNNNKKKLRFNNLYIDMNGVIHNSTHSNADPTMLTKIVTDESVRVGLFKRLDDIINTANPTNVLYIAIDGVPPRAKAIEQRKRRFRSAKDVKDALSKRPATDAPVDLENVFDPNCISPSTEFMTRVNEWMQHYASTIAKRYSDLTIIVSDSTVPGEGEHKIMDFIRKNTKLWPQDTSHLFYGMDADLIFLGLSTHLRHFFVLRDLSSLTSCGTCKEPGHASYECQSALAKKRLIQFEKSNKITIRNLPIQVDEQALTSMLSYHGEVQSVRLEKALTKKPTVTAHIQFVDTESTTYITSRGANYFFNDQKLSIHNVAPEKQQSESPPTPPVSDTIEEDDASLSKTSIFIPNLDTRALLFDVRAFFSSCGPIEELLFIPAPKERPLKYAVIKFKDEESAKKALALNGADFFGSALMVKRSRLQKPQKDSTSKRNDVAPTSPTTIATDPLAEQKLKEDRKLQKLATVNQFLTLSDPGTTLDSAYFYLGISDWDLDKAIQKYLEFGKSQHKTSYGSSNPKSDDQFDFVNLDYLKDYFRYTLLSGLSEEAKQAINFDRLINDFTMMCMLLGNDFIPNIPMLKIKEGSIELMLNWYRHWMSSSLAETGHFDYITNGQHINFDSLSKLLSMIAKWESVEFPEKLEKMHKKEIIRLEQKMGQDSDHFLEPVRRNLDGEINYYKLKIGATTNQLDQTIDEMCAAYLQGLTWVLRYYVEGCPAWGWYYPYHYAPLATDLAKYVAKLSTTETNSQCIKLDYGKPLEPFIHLLSVLPLHSSRLLPKSIASIMESSPIARQFVENFRIDSNGEDVSWKGVVLLDFINTAQLTELCGPIIATQLSDSERARNQFGQELLVHHDHTNIDQAKFVELTMQQTMTRTPGEHRIEIESIYKPLEKIDLLWPHRRFFTLEPTTPDSFHALPTTQLMFNPPTSTLPTEVVISKEQELFLEWREKQSVGTTLETLMSSLDINNCFTLGIDSKISSTLSQVLSNIISVNKEIRLVSDDDQQMIVHISFSQPTRLSGIKLISTVSKETMPKNVKVFFNQTAIDFSSASSMKPNLTLEVKDQSECGLVSPLQTIGGGIHNKLSQLTIFVESNHSGMDNTKTIIEKIVLV
ncbi:hypothetical protein SAMD00019534_021620 [Acytostelium subglobosum LB1]|uniref:hypothetical protein n=1 Tax=Acytostelium subglobosum LB1 TaxID=1410327 RepID=UPI000644E548|nr:hypothetical protein SAMD00019534_021620 [Acytostelium subglobosum LB1]GAM18987.1 hypothetical protein SAMD00019534_021620 [Acytostelium subglobosum LB1]|eukprot:XP_012756914.1 hypothetical protein SAMD00019534_021620 [Acytostelium subglobosum LB1]